MTQLQSFDVATSPETAAPRVAALRGWMEARDLDAFLVPRADRFQGEYVAPCDERLAWLTGFTGSAGFAVILRDRAAVFTDGRYTVQVRAQTDAALFETVLWPDTKLADWLREALPDGGRVGFDPWLHTPKELEPLAAVSNIETVPVPNGVDAVWTDRPAPPAAPARAWPERLAGRPHAEKRREIADAVARKARAFVTTQPDAVCWLLNLRGADIARTPIVQAAAIVHADASVDVVCDPAKLAPVAEHLGADVRAVAWDDLPALLAGLGPTGYDPATCPVALRDLIPEPVAMADPVALPKARKTAAEIAGTTEAHLRDAAAMCRFLRWLDEDRPEGATEIDVVHALEGFRRETDALHDIAFETIAGSGPNGAIVHYRVNEDTDRALDRDGVLLVDSGGQYEDGTTDVTRTIALGTLPAEAAHDATRVLQGLIALSRARFPHGVAGCHLDALARAPLWAEGRDYGHGTGHGVGVFLGVHEGPARISRVSDVPLEDGMILSIEPGYYREGHYGIRLENLAVVRPAPEGGREGDRPMLRFECLTWVPLDRRLVVADLLGPEERAWLDGYHAEVLAKVGPRVDGADRAWLERACAPL
ncbi:aminopeptidase P family protein [Jannaschia sp. W003]|uniref:aminopeptidase P family protein n=1 Tax=Jannaschia sp. W003 TaxID=2867012 RepID=UPI0021A49FA1|nr:aminopeptidase P family protein [Jannaschia sp. W003]UWQ21074.1 aminopeptidase P family protein [Jannaschia sp. W003]